MKRLIIILFPLLLLSACSDDFLDRTPIDRRVIENFYQTPQDALEGLVATYDVLQWDGWGHIHLWSEMMSDNNHGGAGTSDDANPQRVERFESGIDLHADAWRKYYRGIARANLLLENLDRVEWGANEELKTQYEAEARFLRAYFYFDLIRMFGNVPLTTTVVDPNEITDLTQADPADVYALIVDDLNFATENLEAIPYQQIDPADYGRVTRWSAQSLLGRVYLYYTGYYNNGDPEGVTGAQVIAHLDSVIASSGYALVDTFDHLWHHAREKFVGPDNSETVFAIKYTYKGMGDWDLRDGNRWLVFIGLRGSVGGFVNGWGFCTVRPSLWEAYSEEDTRKTASIISIVDEGLDYNTDDQRQYTGYHWKKFQTIDDDHPDNYGGDFQIDRFYDTPVIRFADVLLMAAELHLEQGDAGKAQEYLDMVRERAYLDGFTSVAATKESIMEERRLELAFEGHRYWDLLRWGMDKASEYIDNDDPSGDHTSLESFTVKFRPETKGLLEIPQTQISLSAGALEQNPGWPN